MEPSTSGKPKRCNSWLPHLVVRCLGRVFKKRDFSEFQADVLPVPGPRGVDELLSESERFYVEGEWALQYQSSRKH